MSRDQRGYTAIYQERRLRRTADGNSKQHHHAHDSRHGLRKKRRTEIAEGQIHTDNDTDGASAFHEINGRKNERIIVASNDLFYMYLLTGDHTPIHAHVETKEKDKALRKKARFTIIDLGDGELVATPFYYHHAYDETAAGEAAAAPLLREGKFDMDLDLLQQAKRFASKFAEKTVRLWNKHNGPALPVIAEDQPTQKLYPEEPHRLSSIEERIDGEKAWTERPLGNGSASRGFGK